MARNMKLPLATLAGLAAGMAEPVKSVMAGNVERALNQISRNYTGYNPWNQQWDYRYMKRGLLPLVIGVLISKFVGGAPLNVNRRLAGIPFIKL